MSALRQVRLALLALLLGLVLPGVAEPLAVPVLSARVTDQTGMLSSAQVAALERRLAAFETEKGSQFAVLIVPSTGEESIEQYALRVVEQWRLGRQKVDDGALLIVARDDRTLRIEVGYGLEGALNDATARRIIDEVIVPRFRQGDFYGGIDAGLERMIAVVRGEPLTPPGRAADGASGEFSQLLPLVMLVFVFGGLLRALLGRLPAALLTGGGVTVLSWLLVGVLSIALLAGVIAFVFVLLGGGTGRGSGWHSGGGSRGGFGGGFGGGGGGFGGGGASGRW